MVGPPDLAGVEIAARGKKIYREKIRPLMTESDIGKYVIVTCTAAIAKLTNGASKPTSGCAPGHARRLRLHIGNRWHQLRYWTASAIRTLCVRFLIPGSLVSRYCRKDI